MLYKRMIEDNLDETERVRMSNGKQELSLRGIHERVMRYWTFLKKKGVQIGDRILIINNDPMNTALIALACIAGGYIFVPVSGSVDTELRNEIVQDCEPKLILDSKERISFDDTYAWTNEKRQLLPVSTLVYIIYTSGTEGNPKGVVASQKQIIFCCDAINERLDNCETDRILCCLPLTFDYGLYQVFLALFSGAVIYLEQMNVIQKLPYLLKKWSITAFPVIPTIANLMVKAGMFNDIGSLKLRYISFTGEVLTVQLIKELMKLLPGTRIVPMYGMTECKRVSIMPVNREDKVLEGSCGLPLNGTHVYLNDIDEGNHVGELVVEGDNVMEGYWNNSKDTNHMFMYNEKTGNRVLYTGDLFRMDSEGFLFFYGRKNGIIKIRGFRVSSAWVENQIREIPEVLETAVEGEEDSFTGEHLVIHVYSKQVCIEDSVRRKMKKLPEYLWNFRLLIHSHPFPKNKNGKIDRKRLRYCND